MPTPKNILIDLNIILDLVLNRPGGASAEDLLEPYVGYPERLFMSAHSITTFAYLLGRAGQSHHEVLSQVDWLLKRCSVVGLHAKHFTAALASHMKDYEDAVVEQAALACGAEAIITRNLKDFTHSQVPVYSPEQYLA
ncbi:MAG TPA: PIN domain-containing protein [Candidatus Saccharimonadales bacterium]